MLNIVYFSIIDIDELYQKIQNTCGEIRRYLRIFERVHNFLIRRYQACIEMERLFKMTENVILKEFISFHLHFK